MDEDKNMDYNLDMEIEKPFTPKWPKTARISLIISICSSIVLIVAVIILAVLYSKELSNNSSKESSSNSPSTMPEINLFSIFGQKIPNLPYDENGKIINSFKRDGGENYNETMEEINNGQDYEKNERNIYDLYIPQYALDRINETNGIVLWIHGGGWVNGDKSGMDIFCQMNALPGYIAATMSYTLLDKKYSNFNIFRILDEITACIKAIKKYLLDKGFLENKLRLVIAGYSAGGHLVLLYSHLIKNFPIPMAFVINYVGPIGLEKKYFYKVKLLNDTLENIEDVATINKAVEEGRLIPAFEDKIKLDFMNLFYGNKFNENEKKEMLYPNGTVNETNEKYQEMFNVVKFAYIPEINDYHSDVPIICIYGGIDETVGVSAFAYLNEKAKISGRELKLIYSRKEGHMLIYAQTPDGIEKLWETNSIITKYLKSKIG